MLGCVSFGGPVAGQHTVSTAFDQRSSPGYFAGPAGAFNTLGGGVHPNVGYSGMYWPYDSSPTSRSTAIDPSNIGNFLSRNDFSATNRSPFGLHPPTYKPCYPLLDSRFQPQQQLSSGLWLDTVNKSIPPSSMMSIFEQSLPSSSSSYHPTKSSPFGQPSYEPLLNFVPHSSSPGYPPSAISSSGPMPWATSGGQNFFQPGSGSQTVTPAEPAAFQHPFGVNSGSTSGSTTELGAGMKSSRTFNRNRQDTAANSGLENLKVERDATGFSSDNRYKCANNLDTTATWLATAQQGKRFCNTDIATVAYSPPEQNRGYERAQATGMSDNVASPVTSPGSDTGVLLAAQNVRNGCTSGGGGKTERRKRPPQPVPSEQKDESYWDRRKKNNYAARRSREMKNKEEKNMMERLEGLEAENNGIRRSISELLKEIASLQQELGLAGDSNINLPGGMSTS